MRNEGKAKYETANELIQVMVQKWTEYQGFEMEIINDSVSEISGVSETLSIASITSSMENEDKVEETEQFTKFWELFKMEFNNVISYKKITVESFEELMKINYEEGMNTENIRKMGEGLSYLTKGLKYRRLIPNRDRTIKWMMDMIICSKKFTLSEEDIQRNYAGIVTKPQEDEERSLSPDLSPVEGFLILYQNIVPEIEEINEEEVKKEEIKDKGKGKIGDKKKEEIIDGCKRCNRSWKDCTCQCRKHGYILDCGIEYDEECYCITQGEYEEYQKKSSIFQTLVKIGTYKWNGESYEMINKTKELEDSEEE